MTDMIDDETEERIINLEHQIQTIVDLANLEPEYIYGVLFKKLCDYNTLPEDKFTWLLNMSVYRYYKKEKQHART